MIREGDTIKINLALKYEVDVLYHCEYADEEALDQREAKKDKVFVAPTIGFSWAYAYEAEPWGITKEIAERNGILVTIACDAFRKMRKRGIRALPGAITVLPGTRSATTRATSNISSSFSTTRPRKCSAATKYGGELMGMGNELGLIKEGYLMLLVGGDVVADVTLLQGRNNC